MTAMIRDGAALLSIGAVVATMCVGSTGFGEMLDDALAALRTGYETLAVGPLQDAARVLRARADASDADGSAHYHLARALEGLGLYHLTRGEQEDARRYFEEGLQEVKIAVERRPTAADYHTELGNLYGNLAGQSGVVGKMRNGRLSTAAFTRALELDPRNALAHVGMGIAKLETPAAFGGSIVDALAEFRTARALDPTCDEAWTWEGIALRRQGAVADARRAFTKALDVNARSNHAQRELAALDEDF
jgi:tetratricopeptide (TPR) repeat protein